MASSPGLRLLVLLLLGCGAEQPKDLPAGGGDGGEPTPARWRVVFLGDSLTAGFHLPEEEAYPELVERQLRQLDLPVEVVNAGVSGDTSAGGLERLAWILSQDPDLVVIGLGVNDGLRGLSLEETEANLRRIVQRVRDEGARVLLLGMKLPPNYGPDYAGAFEEIYPRLAEELDLPLMPFLLVGVAGRTELNLRDGVHPNAAGHRRLAANVTPYVAAILEDLAAAGRAG